MTTLLTIFLGTIYGCSGLTCSMAFLRYINKLISRQKSPQNVNMTLALIAIAVFWPLWMIKEIWYTDYDEHDTSLEVREVNCEPVAKAGHPVESAERLSSNINSGCIEPV